MCTEIALKIYWKPTWGLLSNCYKIVLKLLGNCSENRFGSELGSALKLLRNCSETDFELLWNGCAIVLKINLQIHLTWLRNCSETALKLLWNCSETNYADSRRCSSSEATNSRWNGSKTTSKNNNQLRKSSRIQWQSNKQQPTSCNWLLQPQNPVGNLSIFNPHWITAYVDGLRISV